MNKLIIFDFDGVIADSFEYCLKKNKIVYRNITAEKYRSWYYGNFYEKLVKRLGREQFEKIKSLYWKEFKKDLNQIALVPEMNNILRKLAKDFSLIIVSSCDDKILDTILTKEKIKQYFKAVYGSSYHESEAPPTGVGGFPAYPPSLKLRRVTSRIAEPAVAGDKSLPEYTLFAFIHRQSRWLSAKAGKVEKFKHVLRDFEINSKDCIFITDTLGDLVEAESAGLESVAVSWGFHKINTLKKGKSKIIIHKPNQLIPEIEKHFLQIKK